MNNRARHYSQPNTSHHLVNINRCIQLKRTSLLTAGWRLEECDWLKGEGGGHW